MRSEEELAQTLALRRTAFSMHLDRDVPLDEQLGRLEADAYDPYSLHYGAFTTDAQVVGTIRLITTEPQAPIGAMVSRIAAGTGDPLLMRKLMKPRGPELPSLFSAEIVARIAGLNPQGRPLVEVSRLAVVQTLRGGDTARRLMNTALRDAKTAGAFVIGSCTPQHIPMNVERYGFAQLPGLHRHPTMKVEATVIYIPA